MNLKETSDKKLVDDSIDIELNKDYPQYRIELLSRLARGRKAIEALEKMQMCRCEAEGETAYHSRDRINKVIDEFFGNQQSDKEATDDRG